MNTKAVRITSIFLAAFILLMVAFFHQGPLKVVSTVYQLPVITNFIPSIVGVLIGAIVVALHFITATRFTKKTTGPWISFSFFAILFLWVQNLSLDYTRSTSQNEVTNDLIRRCSTPNLPKELLPDCVQWVGGDLSANSSASKAVTFTSLPEDTQKTITANLRAGLADPQ